MKVIKTMPSTISIDEEEECLLSEKTTDWRSEKGLEKAETAKKENLFVHFFRKLRSPFKRFVSEPPCRRIDDQVPSNEKVPDQGCQPEEPPKAPAKLPTIPVNVSKPERQPVDSPKKPTEPATRIPINKCAPPFPSPPHELAGIKKETSLESLEKPGDSRIFVYNQAAVHAYMRSTAEPDKDDRVVYQHLNDRFLLAYTSLCRPKGADPPYGRQCSENPVTDITHNLDGEELARYCCTRSPPPMHPDASRYLIQKYIHPSVQEAAFESLRVRQMNVVLYMGMVSWDDSKRIDNLHLRPGCLDHLWIEAPDRIMTWARTMGTALAVLHYACHVDGTGIRFKLGSEKNRYLMFISNFGECQKIERTALCATTAMVSAVTKNPSWPRPPISPEYRRFHDQISGQPDALKDAWMIFKCGYRRAATHIMRIQGTMWKDGALPGLFLDELTQSAIRAQALGFEYGVTGYYRRGG
ncbi:Fc.00g044370.m01.CDS01 [Cosmosporella sp. VM-42]